MIRTAKQWGFFLAMFLLFSWGISFLAPRPATAPQAPAVDLSWLASIFSDIATAAVYTLGLLLFGLLLYVFVVPYINKVRDREWERKQESATEHQQAASPNERPIIYNGPSNALALKSERAKRENLQLLLDSISDGLSSLCYQVTGQQEPDAVRAIKVLGDAWREMRETMRELDAQLSEVPQEPATASLRGATWLTYESVLALVKAGNVGIKKAQMIARENGGVVGRDDYQRLQEILAYLPSPIDQGGAYESRKQAVNGKPGVGEPANATRKPPAMGRSQPRIRKGKR